MSSLHVCHDGIANFIASQFAQQRAANIELEDQRRQVQELTQYKKQIQGELADLKDRLEVEMMAKNEESSKDLHITNLEF